MEAFSKTPNKLLGQTSPYLLQHLYNPADWHPWGLPALKKAKTENKPLLISIGYSACHWCHVMENECFEDQDVADFMNAHFVCVKVDREERPDVDHVYMNAVMIVEGKGGWPLNCFALPDGRPFWGGTYFPKKTWLSVLMQINRMYNENYDALLQQAESISLATSSSRVPITVDVEPFTLDHTLRFFRNVLSKVDMQEGGLKGAPKFPTPSVFAFLLQYHHLSGHSQAIEALTLTLKKMAYGGIYDQIGGGFARYSTDAKWKVPHFEKMLYDNAQLISLYANAYLVTQENLFRDVVVHTLKFVDEELTTPEGLFYSALDADSQGEEGIYYLWTEKQIEEVLGEDAALVKNYYGVGGKGFGEKGRNILLRSTTDEVFASGCGLSIEEVRQKLESAKNALLSERKNRVKPATDYKIIVSWNAMVICGLLDAHKALGDEKYLQYALRAADAIIQKAISPQGQLLRNLTPGSEPIGGFLEDYAWLCKAFIMLYESTGHLRYMHMAADLARYAETAFSNKGTSMLSFAETKNTDLPEDFFEIFDTVIPSSNSVKAHNFFVLAHFFDNALWAERSQQMLKDAFSLARDYSANMTHWGSLLLRHVFPFYTLVVAGADASAKATNARRTYAPNVLLAVAEKEHSDLPLFMDRYNKESAVFYVCSSNSCQLPVSTFDDAMRLMQPWS